MTADAVPRFDQLPQLSTGERHAWDYFGRDDELGCVNFLTPTVVAEAARQIESGVVVNLNLPLEEPQPQFWAERVPLQHVPVVKHNIRDDRLDSFQMQGSTQWDGLRHQRYREFGWFGGRHEHELDELGQMGIERWAEHGIVGRGVLADVAAYRHTLGAPLDPTSRFPITWALIEATLGSQRSPLRRGDMLLVRTGWLQWYRGLDPAERETLGKRLAADRSEIALPGLDPSQATAAWIWDNGLSALALDNPTAETLPYVPAEGWAHNRLLPLLGLPIGELWHLDELADHCAAQRRYTFFLSASPLNLSGGAGSPANAYAIF